MSLSLIVGLLIILALFAWALRPLLARRPVHPHVERATPERSLEDLLFEREGVLNALRDLQLDHAMGKLSEEDYADLDARYRAQAIALMRQLDALGVVPEQDATDAALDEWIERAVADVRTARPRPMPTTSVDTYTANEAAS